MSTLTNLTDFNRSDAVPSHLENAGEVDDVSSRHSHTSANPVLSVEEIHKLLPHRYPFSLVDRIIEYVPGKRAVGIKTSPSMNPTFKGTFRDGQLCRGSHC